MKKIRRRGCGEIGGEYNGLRKSVVNKRKAVGFKTALWNSSLYNLEGTTAALCNFQRFGKMNI